MSTFTLATLKSAVVDAAIASDKAVFANVTDRKSFIKAVKQGWKSEKFDFRQRKAWLGFAEYLGIDAAPWKRSKSTGETIKDIKAKVLAHYQETTAKGLRKKLDEWGIPYGDLRRKATWTKLWDEVQATPAQLAA